MKKAFGASEDIVKKEKEDDAVTPTGSIESKKIVDNGLITSQSSFKTPPMKGKQSGIVCKLVYFLLIYSSQNTDTINDLFYENRYF